MTKSVRLRDLFFMGVVLVVAILLVVPHEGNVLAVVSQRTYLPVVRRMPSPTPTPSPTPGPGWYVEYFGNSSLTGAPFRAQSEVYDVPEKYWGEGAPLPGMPIDNFSVRFTADKQFQAGNYAFMISVDDGGRLYIDNNLVINEWHGSLRGTATYRWDGAISAGTHRLRVEFYDAAKGARVRLTWLNMDLYPDWKAEYWPNDSMSGAPTVVRNEAEIKYDWGLGSPDPSLPADGFSARWTRPVYFDTGKYVFYTTAEGGGVRFWLDKWVPGQDEVIDDWGIWPNRTKSEDEYLDEQGWYLLTVAYRAGQGKAFCQFKYLYGGASGSWVGEYFTDPNLQNRYTVRNDGAIDFIWGSDRPMSGISRDHFSVRWTHTEKLEADGYKFTATYDDGIRVRIDGSLLIDDWRAGGRRTNSASRALHKGYHVIQVEYFEDVSNAQVQFSFAPDPEIQLFRADYWNTIRMGGEEMGDYTEYMGSVNVDAGLGSPAAGIRADDWSARFREYRDFSSSASYKFTVEYDGGAVLYVDGTERWNDWANTGRKIKSYTMHIDEGKHWIKLHYADRGAGNDGYVRMTIEKQ